MRNWDDLKYCLALDEYQTMTAAAKALGTNIATVSRRIERITEEAGHPLFIRHNSNWIATDLGRELSAVARRIENRIDAAELNSASRLTKTKLQITAPQSIIEAYLLPEANRILKTFPKLEIKFCSLNASLAFGETDLILSHNKPEEGRIFRRHMGHQLFSFYSSSRSQQKLKGWIAINNETNIKIINKCKQAPLTYAPRFSVPSLTSACQLVQKMPLLAYLPCHFAESRPDLVPFDSIEASQNEIWMSYHYTRKKDLVLKRVRDWIESCIKQTKIDLDHSVHSTQMS